jgi:hypothetical protein
LRGLTQRPTLSRLEAKLNELEQATVVDVEPVKVSWEPIPDSPQEVAFSHEADELFYGGSAGEAKLFS